MSLQKQNTRSEHQIINSSFFATGMFIVAFSKHCRQVWNTGTVDDNINTYTSKYNIRLYLLPTSGSPK